MNYKGYELIKTGLNEYDARQNGITFFEAPSYKDLKKLIDGYEAGTVARDGEVE